MSGLSAPPAGRDAGAPRTRRHPTDRTRAGKGQPVSDTTPGRLGGHDIAQDRERLRRRRFYRVAAAVLALEVYAVAMPLTGRSAIPAMPTIDPVIAVPVLFFVALLGILIGTQVLTGRSPHLTYRPEQVDVTLDDVIGIDPIKEDVRRSIDLFQTHRRFAAEMGGTPRRGLLFEGPPGTGKTMTAKAMAAEAGVPFLFVSATSFQSMYYGATAKKIRAYFTALRKAARAEGGAIGFIEEIDAIALRRGGVLAMESGRGRHASRWHRSPIVVDAMTSEGTGGVVNELLVQMQSFDQPTGLAKMVNAVIARINLLLPAHGQIQQIKPVRAPILLIAATNRADSLDPALLRPGRFDRRLTFDPPDARGRRALVDHFLASRSTGPELADPVLRDRLAAATNGWTPVMIEHLMDEGLVNALRRGADAMSYTDIEQARITEMVGIGQPVGYTLAEQRLIATHEAGHAVTAWLVAPNRNLEILTIVKRGQALGLLAHGEAEEVWTQSTTDLRALVQIAMGGFVAEQLFFGETSTGPGGDLTAATRTAAQMVGYAGMTGSLVSFAATGQDLVTAVLGDSAARAQLERVLDDARDRVVWLLSRNLHLVEALRDALLERHELIGDEITQVLHEASQAHIDERAAQAAADAAFAGGDGRMSAA